MKNKTIIISISLFFTLIVILRFVEYRKLTNKFTRLYDNTEVMRVENALLREGFFHSYDFETITINFKTYVQNHKLDHLFLKDTLHNKKTLALFINVESCTSCTYENIKKLKRLQIESKFNIIIGIDGLNNRKFQAFISNNDIKDIAYLLPNGYFEGFYLNPAVYFVIDETLNTRYFFAPSNIYPQLTQDYFDKLERIVFD